MSLKYITLKFSQECYDGQWQNTVMMSEDGFPLNRLRLQNTTWNKVSKLSKKSFNGGSVVNQQNLNW